MQPFKYQKWVPMFTIVRHMATVKRFYRKTNIVSSDGKYEVTLDQRKLKTPRGRIFQVNSKPLALAVAAEWDAQKETIERESMHLTALCNTIQDNPHNNTKIDIVNHVVNCLQMDTILYQSRENEELFKLQKEQWDPIIQWFCDRFAVDMMKTESIQEPVISLETKTTLARHLMSYNHSATQGFMYGVDAIKSVILTLAAAERSISIVDAVRLSRLEEDYQTSHWGSVEWFHEQNKQDLQARLSAAILFVHLNSFVVTSQSKNHNREVS